MSYLFVDRILEVRGDKERPSGAKGLKAVSRSDPFVRLGSEGLPDLSPCFAAEAVGQLAAWIAMAASGFKRRPVAGLTAEAKILGVGRPGEVLVLEVEIESADDDALHYHGTARSPRGPVVALRDSVGPMLPLEDFEDPAAAERQYRQLLVPSEGESGEVHAGVVEAAPLGRSAEPHPAIDAIVERSAEHLRAVTCVPRSAPYLADHFPRAPVLPATLLFDAQMALAMDLARAAAGSAKEVRVTRMRNLKMRDFVRPGSVLISEARIKSRRGDIIEVSLSGRVGERTVSSALAEIAVIR